MDEAMHEEGGTPVSGDGAVDRWMGLLDAAEEAMRSVSPYDPVGQRTARRRLDALFAYEHAMVSEARRQAREAVWRRDRPGISLPPIRGEWEACRCSICRYERRTGNKSALRRLEPRSCEPLVWMHWAELGAEAGAPGRSTVEVKGDVEREVA